MTDADMQMREQVLKEAERQATWIRSAEADVAYEAQVLASAFPDDPRLEKLRKASNVLEHLRKSYFDYMANEYEKLRKAGA